MKPSDDLFDLIQSLEKNEKRYFKLFAALQKGEKIYAALFDAIDKQKVYNETVLLNKFKKTPHQFSSIKNYLYSLILKSLRNYTQNASIAAGIRENLNSAEILMRKGLYSQTAKILSKTKKAAQGHEKYLAHLDILQMERQLGFFFFDKQTHFQRSREADKETGPVFDKLNALHRRTVLASRILSHWETGKPRTAEALKEIRNLFVQMHAGKNETYESTWYYYYIKQHYHRLAGEYKEAYQFAGKAVALIESSPEKMHDDPGRYFAALHNYMSASLDMGKYEGSLKLIRKIRNLSQLPEVRAHKGLLAKIASLTVLVEMLLHVDYKKFERARKLLPEAEAVLKTHSSILTPHDKAGIYYALCNTNFTLGEYKQALPWLNLLLQDPKGRPDMYSFARILNPILHFELGNLYVLDNLLHSIYGYLYKHKALYRSEKAIILGLKKLTKASGKGEQVKILSSLRDQLLSIQKNPHEKILAEYVDVVGWLESKVRKLEN